MLSFDQYDHQWMQLALEYAKKSAQQGEVPVGAVMVENQNLIVATHNQPIQLCDPTAHAEILALRLAGNQLSNYRLNSCTLYVTLEPCPMCFGAITQARLKRVVYAAPDKKLGACGGAFGWHLNKTINSHTEIEGGLLAERSVVLLQNFFKSKRKNKAIRLQEISVLENIPNLTQELIGILRTNGITTPTDLNHYQHDDGLDHMLSWVGQNDELQARIHALHRFIIGDPSNSWKKFLKP